MIRKCTHAPNSNPHKLVEKTPDVNHDKGLAKTPEKGKKKTMFRQLPTAQKSCTKQYEIKIFVLSDQKMHSCAKF